LRTELHALPGVNNHRVEVLDTATHRAAAELIPGVYLARGWETQSDSTMNPLFYDPALLTATSYRSWLSTNAVAWVAVPGAPGANYQSEAALISLGLNYLHPIWHDGSWTVYAVEHPQPIIPAPAQVVSSDETQVAFDVPAPGPLTLKLRPTKFLHIAQQDGTLATICVNATSPDEIQVDFPEAGRYLLTSSFSVTSAVRHTGC
jgi:hypothetical protein